MRLLIASALCSMFLSSSSFMIRNEEIKSENVLVTQQIFVQSDDSVIQSDSEEKQSENKEQTSEKKLDEHNSGETSNLKSRLLLRAQKEHEFNIPVPAALAPPKHSTHNKGDHKTIYSFYDYKPAAWWPPAQNNIYQQVPAGFNEHNKAEHQTVYAHLGGRHNLKAGHETVYAYLGHHNLKADHQQ